MIRLLLFFLFSFSARANVVIPLVSVHWGLEIVLLIPVVLIETLIFVRLLGLRFSSSIWPITWANIVTTILGVLIVVLLSVFLYLLNTVGTNILGQSNSFSNFILKLETLLFGVVGGTDYAARGDVEQRWGGLYTLLITIVWAYFVSIYAEWLILKKRFKAVPSDSIWKAVWKANLGSYVFIVLFVVASLTLANLDPKLNRLISEAFFYVALLPVWPIAYVFGGL